jgi:two-component system, OmpR family, sensor histidine kinase ChvG
MGSDTRLPDANGANDADDADGADRRVRRRLRVAAGAVWNHLFRIRYRLLLVNVIVVAVPIVGIGFARTFEREMLHSLENGMIHQAEVLRQALVDDPTGLRLDQRSPMLERAAQSTRTRIRLLDARGQVVADSHWRGPPEGAEKPTPSLFGAGKDSYHPPETPKLIDVSDRSEVRRALRGRYGAATRLWENRARVYLFSALPITMPDSEQVLGAVYVTRSTAPVKFAMYRLRTWLFVILAAAVAVTAILSLFLAGTIARPLSRLTRIAGRIAAGDRRQTLALKRRDEIGQLARAFDAMTRRLDARAHYASELAANISHEFKSPLTSIRGAAELLREGAVDDLPAREKFLGNIIEDSARLDRLVTRLLELSRLEADTTATEHFDYEALVREVVDHKARALEVTGEVTGEITGEVRDDAVHGQAAPGQRKLELSYRSKTTQLCGRRSHIASALQNLIDNALQHAEPGTTVSVVVSDGPGGVVRTAVTNRGPIISAAIMQRMWDRFFTTRVKQGGTGLGLAIVASIAEAHGGTASATSTVEHGTTFCLDLPPG